MRISPPLFLLLALSLACVNPSRGAQVTVGETKLELPEPRGCVELTPEMEPAYGVATSFVPKSNRLLAYFVAKAALEDLKAGREPDFSYNLTAQCLRNLEGRTLGPKEFKEICDLLVNQNQMVINRLEKEAPGMFAEISAQVEAKTQRKLDLKDAKIVPLKPHEQTPNSLAFISLLSTGGTAEQIMVDNSIILVNGKVLFLYFTSPDSQTETVQAVGKEWREAVLAANPTSAATQAATAGSDSGKTPSNILQRALIGGIVGAVLGAIIGIIRGRKIRRERMSEKQVS